MVVRQAGDLFSAFLPLIKGCQAQRQDTVPFPPLPSKSHMASGKIRECPVCAEYFGYSERHHAGDRLGRREADSMHQDLCVGLPCLCIIPYARTK